MIYEAIKFIGNITFIRKMLSVISHIGRVFVMAVSKKFHYNGFNPKENAVEKLIKSVYREKELTGSTKKVIHPSARKHFLPEISFLV